MIRSIATIVCSAALCAGPVFAQPASQGDPNGKYVQIARTTTPPVLDGQLDDPVWMLAAVVDDMHQILPNEYDNPSERTTVYLLYDDNYLYVGARMHHEHVPMLATRLRQGENYWGDDLFSVMLDTFNDQRNGYRFQVNSNGVRMQALFQDTTRELWDWNGIWDVQVTRDGTGWTAELAIPFKTVSFDPEGDTWGINFRRDIGYGDERTGWVSYNRTQNPANFGRVSGLEGMELGMGLDIVPSVSATESKIYDPDSTDSTDSNNEPSLDVYYKLSSSMNASLTINTDFSATEVDDRQVNLTRFNAFFPEKRDFFLREFDIFQFGRLGRIQGQGGANATFSRPSLENGSPFFSRRIGLSATGEPVDLEAGAKVSGRIGRFDLGALAIRQDEFADIEATDLFVGRIAANVLAESSIGLIATNGDPRTNLDNSLVGIDFRYINTRLASGKTLEGEAWAQRSETEGVEGDDGAWGLRLRSPNSGGLRWGLGVKELQANFNPALGYVNRKDVRDYTGELGYTWRFRRPYMRAIYSGLDAQRFDSLDGELQTQVLTWRLFEISSNRRDDYRLYYYDTRDVLSEPFEIWDDGSEQIVIPAGDYSFGETQVTFEAGPLRKVFGEFSARVGDFYGGERTSVSGSIGWRPSMHFTTRLGYEINDVELPQGDFVARLISLRADVVFSSTMSWVTLLQYDNYSETVGINSRIHWIPQAGREAFIVLNHGLQDLDRDNSFRSANADLTLKYSYTFRF
ncbi:MAG TPA: sugar-binding protein [Gammaproteobacteria bacterium]|nr:sugar-binding protein [Gammaproteobacteria bacterium]